MCPENLSGGHLNQKLTATGTVVNVAHPSQEDTLKKPSEFLFSIFSKHILNTSP